MRLLLDVHISPRAVATQLRKRGHDVLAADEDPRLAAMSDRRLLELGASQGRVMVTCDVSDFPKILREWGEEGRHHAGCVVLLGIDHREFGVILRVLDQVFRSHPDQDGWRNCPLFVSRADQ